MTQSLSDHEQDYMAVRVCLIILTLCFITRRKLSHNNNHIRSFNPSCGNIKGILNSLHFNQQLQIKRTMSSKSAQLVYYVSEITAPGGLMFTVNQIWLWIHYIILILIMFMLCCQSSHQIIDVSWKPNFLSLWVGWLEAVNVCFCTVTTGRGAVQYNFNNQQCKLIWVV